MAATKRSNLSAMAKKDGGVKANGEISASWLRTKLTTLKLRLLSERKFWMFSTVSLLLNEIYSRRKWLRVNFSRYHHIPLDCDYDFDCERDTGKVFSCGVDKLVFNLGEIRSGVCVTYFNTGLDGTCELMIRPHFGNGILYNSDGSAGSI